MSTYAAFLRSPSASHWKKVGLGRRAGVAVPLFSVYSRDSLGIGDFADLEKIVDWCVATGQSVVQLLPLNDTGSNFRPYDSLSSFALDPMYLALRRLRGVDKRLLNREIRSLRKAFPRGGTRVDYRIKKEKMRALARLHRSASRSALRELDEFRAQQDSWLTDYALFCALRSRYREKSWERWPVPLRVREGGALARARQECPEYLRFLEWVQWQCYLQMSAAKRYAGERGVLLMGDLPLLVSRDSADVWVQRQYFDLERVSGAPPDTYCAQGQRWGMPPYCWDAMRADGFSYLARRLRYAECFYDMYRLDHFVGLIRLWTISKRESPKNGGIRGRFDPQDESAWEPHGREVLQALLRASDMLPCAEDLGIVPPCSFRILREHGIPGSEVQRWMRGRKKGLVFTGTARYRKNSVCIISTHDMTSLPAWWRWEAGTMDSGVFVQECRAQGLAAARLSNKLFVSGKGLHGRLRWRDGLSAKRLEALLGKGEREMPGVFAGFRDSYGEREAFWRFAGLDAPLNPGPTPALAEAALRAANRAASVFSVQSVLDWQALDARAPRDYWRQRFNLPSTTDRRNWSLRLPRSLEHMLGMRINRRIRSILRGSGRFAGGRGPAAHGGCRVRARKG